METSLVTEERFENNNRRISVYIEKIYGCSEVCSYGDGFELLSDLDLERMRAKIEHSIACLQQGLEVIRKIRG